MTAAALLGLIVPAGPARAATLTITESTVCVDGTAANCPLIRFIEQANANSEADTIDLGGHTVSLSVRHSVADNFAGGGTALPSIVAGGGALTIRNGTIERVGSDNMRLMHVASDGNLRLFDVTLRGGGQPGRGHGSGGAIFSRGTLYLERCTVTGNNAPGSSGGGIAVRDGTTTLVNSTVSGNAASGGTGGGLAADGFNGGSPRLVLIHTTVTGNSGSGGGGLFSANNGLITLRNSLIAGNTATNASSRNEAWFIGGPPVSEGGNLFGHSGSANTDGFTPGANDLVPAGALNTILDTTLANNGGPTPTHALLPGSPAVNSVASGCAANAIDQRGQLRPETSACDAGAFELSGRYVVTTLDDPNFLACHDSYCTLRGAIASANSTAGIPDIISFNIPGGGVISLASELPEITAAGGPVRIDGPTDAAQSITLDGRNSVRLMGTAAGSVLGVNNLTLRNGRTSRAGPFGPGDGGGAIRARGAVTLNHCVLTGNQAAGGFAGTASGSGGAIESSAALTIINSQFSSNGILGTNGGAGSGGAIRATGSLTVIGSTFTGNAASASNNFVDQGGNGGAISATGPVSITGSTFVNNSASLGGNIGGDGGAIQASGSLSVASSTFTGNVSGVGSLGRGGHGGAIEAAGPISIVNSTFTANRTGVGLGVQNGIGGAVHARGALTIINSTLVDNVRANPFASPVSVAGSAISTTGTVPTLINTIISSASPGLCAGFSGSANGQSNLATDTSCGSGGLLVGGAPVTVDALNLGTLASNGGLTQTMAPKVGSVAIDAGSDADCAADPVNSVDQRGVSRPQEARCDVGAFEAALTNVSITKTASPETVLVGDTVRFTLTVRNLDSRPVSAVGLSDLVPSEFRVDAVTPGSALCLTGSNNTVTCALPTLAPNATATVLIDTTALSAGAITNTATAGDTGTDRDSRDNGSSATVTVVAQDTTPDAITFDSRSNVARSSTQTSHAVTIGGLNVGAPISVSSGSQYSIGCTDTGFTDVAGTIGNGQTVCVRHTAASAFGTDTVTTLAIGDVSATFTSTTEARDIAPDAFRFDSVMGVVEPGSTQRSGAITVSGVNDSTPFSITGGAASTNGLPCDPLFGATSGTVSNGTQITVCHIAGSFGSINTTTLTLGADGVLMGTSASFSSTTRAAVVVPDAFTFGSITGMERGSQPTSTTITITGIEASVSVSVDIGEVSINGGAFGSGGTLEPGQTVQVRHTASSAFAGTVTSTVTIGGVQGSFSSTTRDAVVVPDAFTFASNANAERGSIQTSNIVTISGLEAAAMVTVSNGEVSINGGAFGSGGTLEPGQTVQVRHTASASFAGTVTSTVTIGGVQGSFSSTTVAEVLRPVLSLDNTDLQFDRGLVLRFRDITLNTRSAPEAVTLTNTGNAPLTISRISTTGDFRHTTTCGTTVAAGASCTISIVFRPTDVGTRTGETRIVSNAASSPDLIRLSGTGKGLVPGIRTSTSSQDFGSVKLGSIRSRTLTITSAGTGPLEIRSVASSGDYSSSHNCPRLLEAGKRCTVTTRLRPTDKGPRPGNLTIDTSAPGSPAIVGLTGNGS